MKYRSLHAQKAERWLGSELYEKLLTARPHWPIPVMGEMGGPVWSYNGDLVGRSWVGSFCSFADLLWERWRKAAKRHGTLSTGFASLSDLISEATTGGKQQVLHYTKAGTTGVIGVTNSLARVGAIPAGQATAAAFAAGESPTSNTPAGLGIGFINADGSDTLHIVSATSIATIASQLLLLYDRFYQGNWDVSVTPRTVTGVPTRYQSTASRGCFIGAEVSTALGAGTPTVDVTYVDQDGNTAEATTSDITIVGSSIVNRFPAASPDWQFRLNAGDVGVRAITNLALSAGSTGNLNVFLGKPLAFMPLPPLANTGVSFSFINSAFSLPEIVDDACLCLLELQKSLTNATSYTGYFVAVSG